MDNVTVDLKALYDKFNDQLKNGEIIKQVDGEFEYYDLLTDHETVCMDGETCKNISSGKFGYELVSENEENESTFVLTNEEYNIGTFESKL